ncbi:MAG: 2Fe-2S iron-sulfur cluster-binding protein [Dehalococcoidia bacterium]
MATITVDGKTIEAPAGAPLVEVLKQNGVYISNLCYIDGLKPYAGCRSCLVDVQGPPGFQLSCTTQVQDNMVVTTDSDDLKEARKAVVSIILANHSDRCLTCHRREHCHPGDICLRDDVVTHRCLTCSKNYRCELQATCEMVGMSGYEPWVGEERSWYQTPQPPADRANPYMEFDPQMCIICTRCQRACDEKRHTGAITLSGRGWDTRIAFGSGGAIHESNCDFSGACIDVCPTAALMEHPNKWVAKPDTWTTTTCDSCAVGCSIKLGSKDGRGNIVRPNASGNAVSGDQICVRGRYHYDSLKPRERLSKHTVRRGAIHVPVTTDEAIAEAARQLKEAAARGKVGVLVGATATVEEAWLARRIAAEAFKSAADSSLGPVMRAVRTALEARLGTWRTAGDLAKVAAAKTVVVIADDLEESHNVLSVRVKDAAVRARAKVLVIGSLRSELVDFAAAWVRPHGGEEGLAAAQLADAVRGGTPPPALVAAVEILKAAQPGETMIVCAPNPVSPAVAGSMAAGAANLAIALFGAQASDHLAVLPAEVNVHGLQDAGVAIDGGTNPLDGLAGLLVVRDDPTMRLPGAAAALDSIATIVAIDSVASGAVKRATAVLAEGRAYAGAGTYTQADHRAQKLAPAIRPEGDAQPLYQLLRDLGAALGLSLPADADAALGEVAAHDARYRPAWDLILGEGVRLDVPAAPKATAVPVDAIAAGEGIRIVTGRDLYTALDAASARHPEAERLHRYDHIQVSEQDAARLGISDEDIIEVTDGTATLRAPASVTERVREGTVFISSLLQGGAVANFLASSAIAVVRVGVPVTA